MEVCFVKVRFFKLKPSACVEFRNNFLNDNKALVVSLEVIRGKMKVLCVFLRFLFILYSHNLSKLVMN